MSDFSSSNNLYGGQYDAGIVLNETPCSGPLTQQGTEDQASITLDDKLWIRDEDQIEIILYREENDTEDPETTEEMVITVPEDKRQQLAQYFLEVAAMLLRSRPSK